MVWTTAAAASVVKVVCGVVKYILYCRKMVLYSGLIKYVAVVQNRCTYTKRLVVL